MENEVFREERFYFRLIGLTEDQKEKLKKYVKSFKEGKHWKTGEIVLSFPLEITKDYGFLENFLHEAGLSDEKFGIYISLITDNDNDGISVPDYILKIYKRVGGRIDFSIIAGSIEE